MSFLLPGTRLLTEFFNITSVGGLTDITPINVGSRPFIIYSIVATETGGATPDLTVIVYDPKTTTSYYRRNAKAFASAKATERDLDEISMRSGMKLRAQVSSGSASIFVNYLDPNAAGQAS